MDENSLKLLKRIKETSDGKDFIEFLVNLSKENYKALKLEGGDVLRGKAIAYDFLVEAFETCETRLNSGTQTKTFAIQ